jgi:hypothetical protein
LGFEGYIKGVQNGVGPKGKFLEEQYFGGECISTIYEGGFGFSQL